jgi:hypothetical protein
MDIHDDRRKKCNQNKNHLGIPPLQINKRFRNGIYTTPDALG